MKDIILPDDLWVVYDSRSGLRAMSRGQMK